VTFRAREPKNEASPDIWQAVAAHIRRGRRQRDLVRRRAAMVHELTEARDEKRLPADSANWRPTSC
jgi:hypothetical protein